jgi:hypothetical protein
MSQTSSNCLAWLAFISLSFFFFFFFSEEKIAWGRKESLKLKKKKRNLV